MSNLDMEKALQKMTKKQHGGAQHGAPQSARTILEENKQLIQEKLEKKALERKLSRDFNESLIAKSHVVTENEQARDISRKHAKRELAQYYKSKIAEKEAAKASEYSRKVDGGSEIQFFPFDEGESITKSREAQSQKMRDEMRSFLTKQRTENPPRMDPLLADTDTKGYGPSGLTQYPVEPIAGRAPQAVSQQQRSSRRDAPAMDANNDEVAPHMQRHPHFLTKAREHMSRRLHDAHVRQALED